MKIFFLMFSIMFIVFTFVGAGYVLYHGGGVNAGYAAIPMIFSLAGLSFYRKYK